MVSETTKAFSEVSVQWQRKVKTLEGGELETTHSRLREIEALIKSQMAVVNREEAHTTAQPNTIAANKDHRAMTVLSQSLLFTLPFQLQV